MLTPAAMNQSGTKSPAAMTLIVWAMYLPFALTGGSGGGAAWRPRPPEPAHELALTRHLRLRAILGDPAPRQPVIPCDEGIAPIPHQATRAVHRRVREAPEWIGVIRQKVRRDQRVVLGPDDITAQRAEIHVDFTCCRCSPLLGGAGSDRRERLYGAHIGEQLGRHAVSLHQVLRPVVPDPDGTVRRLPH